MTLAAIQPGMFTDERHRMVEGMFCPRGLGGMAATAWDRDTVRTDVAGLTILWATHLVLLVTLLATFPGHDAALARRFVLGNNAAMATGASQGGIAMRLGNSCVAHGAITHVMGFGGGGHFARAVHMHQTTVTVGALLFVVLGMSHAQSGAHACLWTRFPGMATQTTRVMHICLGGHTIVRGKMRQKMLCARGVHFDIAAQAGLGVAV